EVDVGQLGRHLLEGRAVVLLAHVVAPEGVADGPGGAVAAAATRVPSSAPGAAPGDPGAAGQQAASDQCARRCEKASSTHDTHGVAPVIGRFEWPSGLSTTVVESRLSVKIACQVVTHSRTSNNPSSGVLTVRRPSAKSCSTSPPAT